MDRDTELRSLFEAHGQLTRAGKGIARQRRWVDLHAGCDPEDLLRGQRLLQTMRETRSELLKHRDAILQRLRTV